MTILEGLGLVVAGLLASVVVNFIADWLDGK
jgi:hypothetical protein